MLNKFQISSEYKQLFLHILLGFLSIMLPIIATLVYILSFSYYLIKAFSKKSTWVVIPVAIVYLTSWEILLRMNYVFLPWEIGKLTALFFLLLGIARFGVGFRKFPFVIMLLFLLPSFLTFNWTDVKFARESITFQLGGLIVLAFSGIFLSGRVISFNDLSKILIIGLLPAITLLVSITLKSPAISDINFGLAANFSTSGGFGPNQVSTFLGFGLLVLIVHNLLIGPVWMRYLDLVLMSLILVRILFTFSRGGLVGALLPLLFTFILISFDKEKLKIFLKSAIFLFPVLLISFYLANDKTNGLLFKRFKGETYASELGLKEVNLSSASSGRSDILETDWEIFLDNSFLGVGIGESNRVRPKYGFENISHTEQSRLLAEHGIFGALILLTMIWVMISFFYNANRLKKLPILIFALFSFLTMFHSATRLALPCFVFGLGFVILINAKNSIPRKSS